MMKKNKTECLLCGETSELKYDKYPGYQAPQCFEIYHCPFCMTAFSLPRIKTDQLYEKIYQKGELVPEYNRYWKYASNVKNVKNPLEYLSKSESVYWSIKEALSLYVRDKKRTKILEIGSGLGYLTYSLNISNYNVIGMDISQNAVDKAKESFGDYYICADLFEYSHSHAGTFDIVILTEVIEHIDKPIEFVNAINMLLKPQGLALITTPNKSIYPKDVIWASSSPPIHLWWFCEESLKFIAEKLNFDVHFINFYDYYRSNFNAVDIKTHVNKIFPSPTFNENGELVNAIDIKRSNFNRILHLTMRVLSKIPLSKKIYGELMCVLKTDIIYCKEKGTSLCAVFIKR